MRTLPKATERLSCEIGMLAFWLPILWKILEACTNNNSNKYGNVFLRGQGVGRNEQRMLLTYLSEDPGLTTYFFLGVMGWGDGDSPVCRRRRRTPGIIRNSHFLIKSRKFTIFYFRTGFLVKNNPRRVRRRLAQRLY